MTGQSGIDGQTAAGCAAPIRVLVVDDHHLVRSALVDRLAHEDDLTVVGQCEDGAEVVEAAGRLRPDVVCMDLSMPVMDGLSATEALREARPGTPVVVLTGEGPGARPRAAAAGARAVVPKGACIEELIHCLRTVAGGGEPCHHCL